MPSVSLKGCRDWINTWVSPSAAVLAVINGPGAWLLTDDAVRMFGARINPFWIYVVAWFSVAIPLSVALSPLARRLYEAIGGWWTRDQRLFDSLRGIVGEITLIESGIHGDGEMARLDHLENDLHYRLTMLGINPAADRTRLVAEVLYGSLRRARRL